MSDINKTTRAIYARINRAIKSKNLNIMVSLNDVRSKVISYGDTVLTESQITEIVNSFTEINAGGCPESRQDDNLGMIDLYNSRGEIQNVENLPPALVNQAANNGIEISQTEIDDAINFIKQSEVNYNALEDVISAMLTYTVNNRKLMADRISNMVSDTNTEHTRITQDLLHGLNGSLKNNNQADLHLLKSFQDLMLGK
jgi:hypothetical protein